MTAAKLIHRNTPDTSHAANDGQRSPAAAIAISDLRAAMGRCALESTWAKLTDQAKSMILYGARMRPVQYITIPLSAMTDDEREQIRMAIIAMQNAVIAFGRQDLSRAAFANITAKTRPIKTTIPPAITKHRPDKLEALQELVAELAESEQQRSQAKRH